MWTNIWSGNRVISCFRLHNMFSKESLLGKFANDRIVDLQSMFFFRNENATFMATAKRFHVVAFSSYYVLGNPKFVLS